MMLVAFFSLKTIESLQNEVAIRFWVTPVFSMRTVSLASSHSCCSGDADVWCKKPPIDRIICLFVEYQSEPIESWFLPPANEVWGKVIFLYLSVILFTGGGGTWIGTSHGQVPPRAGTPPAGHPHQVHPRQVHPPSVHAGIRSTSGRYASYWNAFLSVFWPEESIGKGWGFLVIYGYETMRNLILRVNDEDNGNFRGQPVHI